MYPLGHLVAGYLAYSVATHLTRGRSPMDVPVLALLVGTQFPDLIDKPLSWWFDVIPASRTLAHSIYVAVILLAIVGFVATHLQRDPEALAFGFGYISHLITDALYPFLQAESATATFLTWPLTPPIVYVSEWELVPYLEAVAYGPALGVELALAAVVVVVWLGDGKPGVSVLRRVGARWRGRIAGG